MMKLPVLTEEERVWINQAAINPIIINPVLINPASQPDSALILAQSIAERIRLQLQAMLGIQIETVTVQVFLPSQEHHGVQPKIQIDAALAAIWIDLRYGGMPSKWAGQHYAEWLFPLEQEVRRALAAAVINQDCNDAWPQAMQLRLQMGGVQGAIDISLDNETVRSWAWQHIRAKPSEQRRGRH